MNIITNNEYISIATANGSVAQLSKLDNNIKDNYCKEFNFVTGNNTYYFNRLKAKPEGIGEGTRLMKALVSELDKANIDVILEVNPYGAMNIDQLLSFYSKYNFVLIIKIDNQALMVRRNNSY